MWHGFNRTSVTRSILGVSLALHPSLGSSTPLVASLIAGCSIISCSSPERGFTMLQAKQYGAAANLRWAVASSLAAAETSSPVDAETSDRALALQGTRLCRATAQTRPQLLPGGRGCRMPMHCSRRHLRCWQQRVASHSCCPPGCCSRRYAPSSWPAYMLSWSEVRCLL